jgi:DNA-binding transcriptional MerR regulator
MNETPTHTWKLEELAQQAGVSARTVRYYVQRGLLPAPVFRGRDTVYSGDHLLKLKAIRRLQERFVSLDAIQRQLAHCSPDELNTLVAEQETANTPASKTERQTQAPRLAPLSPTTVALSHLLSERWQRWILAPGLELHLAEDADAVTRQQAEALLSAWRRGTIGEVS